MINYQKGPRQLRDSSGALSGCKSILSFFLAASIFSGSLASSFESFKMLASSWHGKPYEVSRRTENPGKILMEYGWHGRESGNSLKKHQHARMLENFMDFKLLG